MGDLEIPRDPANYGDILLSLHNHVVVIHVDIEICPVLFIVDVKQS